MKLSARSTIYGSVAAATLLMASGPSFAIEPADFGNILRGASIGTPLAASAPPGVYAGAEFMWSPGAYGVGQQNGSKIDGYVEAVPIIWSTGWNFLGGNITLDVIQPFFQVDDYFNNHIAGCGSPPMTACGNLAYFPNVHNTTWEARDSWNWKNGWFTSLGMTLVGPDGSTYNGTLNPDYWSYIPNGAIAYLSKDWAFSANFFYEINAASAGHGGMGGFGRFALGTGPLGLLPGAIQPAVYATATTAGTGYRSGDEFFADLALLYKTGKWQLGPIAYIKAQTTTDSPGGGLTCATMSANSFGVLTCGKEEDIALGGAVGYNFGPVDLNVWVTDTVSSCHDTFCGLSVWMSTTFRLWGPEAAAAPMVSKAK